MTRSGDIERLGRSGLHLRARLLDVRRLDSATGCARAAVVVPKFGFTAVQRNRLKRRLRELIRMRLLPLAGPFDLLVRARREAYSATFERLREDVDQVARQVAAATDNAAGLSTTPSL